MKSEKFKSVIFAKFQTAAERDEAILLIWKASIREDGNHIWAKVEQLTEKRSIASRVLWLKYLMKEWG